MKPDFSNITQEEHDSLIDKDGHLRETPEEAKDSPEPGSEEKEAKETEEKPDKEEPKGEDSIDWDKLPASAKAAYEAAQKESEKLRKDYGKLHRRFDRSMKSQKEFESFRAQASEEQKLLKRLVGVLESDPKLYGEVEKRLRGNSFSFENQDVPDYLKQDPMYQLMESRYLPYIKSLEERLGQFGEKTSLLDKMQAEREEARNQEFFNSQMTAAKSQLKKMFGREPTEDEEHDVLEWIVDNQAYGNPQNPESFVRAGRAAAMEVFGDQYEEMLFERKQAELKEKAKKFPSRTKTVNPSRAVQQRDSSDPDEAIRAAFEEHGITF